MIRSISLVALVLILAPSAAMARRKPKADSNGVTIRDVTPSRRHGASSPKASARNADSGDAQAVSLREVGARNRTGGAPSAATRANIHRQAAAQHMYRKYDRSVVDHHYSGAEDE